MLGRDKEDGRVMDPEDVRTLTMTSFAAGATGVLNLRYRPLLDGPLFGAFGSYGMDGSRTPRSDEASRIAKWANAPEQKPLWEARPVKGDIALLVIPEAQAWDYLLNHNHKPETYREAMWGAYRGFLDNGLQPDWVHIDHIDDYDTIYAPYPIMLTTEHAKALADLGRKGRHADLGGDARAISATAARSAPYSRTTDSTWSSARAKSEVEFMPDIGDRIHFYLDGAPVGGGGFLQSYTATTGKPRGTFDDGRLAVVENTLRQGPHPARRHPSGRRLLQNVERREPCLLRKGVRVDRPEPQHHCRQPRCHRETARRRGGRGDLCAESNPLRTESHHRARRRQPVAQARGYLLGNRRRPNRRGASPRHPDSEVAQLERNAGPARGNGSARAPKRERLGDVVFVTEPDERDSYGPAGRVDVPNLRLMKLCAQEEIAHRMISVTAKCHQNGSER